uniref:Tropomyosin n=1 Tax=Glossina brevipalpis TaxID=37001 RepID=A0A1A9W718_9MUSC
MIKSERFKKSFNNMVENVCSDHKTVNTSTENYSIWRTVTYHKKTSKKQLSHPNTTKKNLTQLVKENFVLNQTINSRNANVDGKSKKVATLGSSSSKKPLNNNNTLPALQKERKIEYNKKSNKSNTISSVLTAPKIHNVQGKNGSGGNKLQSAVGSAILLDLPRRKRSNQIRQIKRAHRHLLTSGGNDKQQPTLQSQRAVNKINYHVNSCSTTKTLQENARGRGRESGALPTSGVKKNNNKGGTYNHCQENIQTSSQHYTCKKKHHKSNGGNKQANGKHTYRRTIKKKSVKSINQNCSASITSPRWCSIEKQLDLLEKLLHYCDEEGNAALQDWCQQLNVSFWSYTATPCARSENEDADSANVNDWSWSDIMSARSIPSSEDGQSSASTASDYICSTQVNMSLAPSSLKRRGHQHHPRFSGTRRPNVAPNVQEILAALNKREIIPSQIQSEVSETDASSSALDDSYSVHYADEPDDDPATAQRIKAALNLPLTDSVTTSLGSNSPTPTDDSSMVDEGVISAQTPLSSSIPTNAVTTQMPKEKKPKIKRDKNALEQIKEKKHKKQSSSSKRDKQKRSSAYLEAAVETSNDAASAAMDEGIAIDDDDVQTAEWAKLRCTSEAAEIVAEREARRSKNRCSDYPGLAFGRSIFSSDTMMKFNIIRNELHNIMNTQLKRAESEVAALNRRIQLLEEDLERSEERLGSATAKLSEASQAADESERARKILENRALADEERMDALENQLKEARFLAEEADKKYDEVARKLAMVEADLERAEERAEQGENKIVELEEELRVVGNNLKSLEVSEEKAGNTQRLIEQEIVQIKVNLETAEARAEFAERSVQKLQKEVDRLEDELIIEKERFAIIGDSLDLAFVEFMGMPPVYNDRHPKPPTPRSPTPVPEEDKVTTTSTDGVEDEQAITDIAAEEATITSNDLQMELIEEVPPEPAELAVPPPPPPFEYALDLPPEGAEVPYVKNYEKPIVPEDNLQESIEMKATTNGHEEERSNEATALSMQSIEQSPQAIGVEATDRDPETLPKNS